jgi:hypothetical protein
MVNIKVTVLGCGTVQSGSLKMEASGSTETVVPVYWTTQHHITKDCNLKPSEVFLYFLLKVCCIKMCIKPIKMKSDMKTEFQLVDVPFSSKKLCDLLMLNL